MMMSVNIFCVWEACETASEGICGEEVSDASWGVGIGDAFSLGYIWGENANAGVALCVASWVGVSDVVGGSAVE